jgi:hypothetical protein
MFPILHLTMHSLMQTGEALSQARPGPLRSHQRERVLVGAGAEGEPARPESRRSP